MLLHVKAKNEEEKMCGDDIMDSLIYMFILTVQEMFR